MRFFEQKKTLKPFRFKRFKERCGSFSGMDGIRTRDPMRDRHVF